MVCESSVAKTSISIDAADLKWLRAWARKHHKGNLSAAVAEGMRVLQHIDRMRSLMDYLGAPELTDADRARLDRELDGLPRARAKRSKRAA